MGSKVSVSEEEVLAITGGCFKHKDSVTFVKGKASTWVWWIVSDVKRISLEVRTLNIKCENAETIDGDKATVTMQVEYCVSGSRDIIRRFYEELLGKSTEYIEDVIKQQFESELKLVIGELNFMAIKDDCMEFRKLVRDKCLVKIIKMGIEIVDITITDVHLTSVASPDAVKMEQPM